MSLHNFMASDKHSSLLGGGGIAPWVSLRLPSSGLGSNPKHNNYAFSICIEIVVDIGMRKGRK